MLKQLSACSGSNPFLKKRLAFFLTVLFFCAAPLFAEEASVKRVIDGDTFETYTGDRVRFIGIDAPEYKPWKGEAEFMGKESTEYLKKLLERKSVRLESEIELKDKYGRRLAHVYSKDGLYVNGQIVRDGMARAKVYSPNNRETTQLRRLEADAKAEKKGIWSRTSKKAGIR